MPNAQLTNVNRDSGAALARGAGISALALVGGAVMLIGLFLAYYLGEFRSPALDTVTFTHEQLDVLSGEAHREAPALVVPATSRAVKVLVSSPTITLPARIYDELSWNIDGLAAAAEIRIVWVTQEAPGHLQGVNLPRDSHSLENTSMRDVRGWEGTIQGVGLLVSGPLELPLSIRGLVLKPKGLDAIALLSQLWQEWTVFEGWHGRSPHFIVGGTRGGLLSPVLAAALWVGLSAILYTGLRLWQGRPLSLLPYAIFFLSGWLLLDLRWQTDLWRQLSVTRRTFADKNWEEKRLAAPDREIFRFVQLIRDALPEDPARIFVVSADPTGTGPGSTEYLRLRVHYHLLPHNVYSQGAKPPSKSYAKPGDFILILGSMPDVSFDPQHQDLRWDGAAPLPVTRIHEARMGTLYRVM